MYYVAVDVGCIECGEESKILGVFTTRKQAQKVCKENEKLQEEEWRGQYYFYVDEISEINVEYSPYKNGGENK